ncbi:MAG: hypothetical protein UR27_C0006G0028 [Candidatus Peregrinibacteria bacterium GW2011_GWA2_33_10]|nr:MAG: hypothetical protein UR27_C0006G0028 [Candidatus Peregrinibacteria bacterium GW2011_GWA2_33_10]KKP39602.1 MAG: hypothetical protein UR30_C0009G0023 [Candidatus Peregrinibacteria bacterium GW2011_GWC2_33_13]
MLPFFLLILVGLTVVLLVKFVLYYVSEDAIIEKQEVIFYSDKGEGSRLTWRSSKWDIISSNTKLLEGDTIKTPTDSKSMLSFYGSNFVRIDENSSFVLNSGNNDDIESPKTKMRLLNGRFWIDFRYDVKNNLELEMGNIWLETNSGLLDVRVDFDYVELRVLEGEIAIKVIENEDDKIRLLDTETVSAGYKVIIDKEVMDYLTQMETINYVLAIEKEYSSSEWFLWNDSQNKSANSFIDIKFKKANIEKDFK